MQRNVCFKKANGDIVNFKLAPGSKRSANICSNAPLKKTRTELDSLRSDHVSVEQKNNINSKLYQQYLGHVVSNPTKFFSGYMAINVLSLKKNNVFLQYWKQYVLPRFIGTGAGEYNFTEPQSPNFYVSKLYLGQNAGENDLLLWMFPDGFLPTAEIFRDATDAFVERAATAINEFSTVKFFHPPALSNTGTWKKLEDYNQIATQMGNVNMENLEDPWPSTPSQPRLQSPPPSPPRPSQSRPATPSPPQQSTVQPTSVFARVTDILRRIRISDTDDWMQAFHVDRKEYLRSSRKSQSVVSDLADFHKVVNIATTVEKGSSAATPLKIPTNRETTQKLLNVGSIETLLEWAKYPTSTATPANEALGFYVMNYFNLGLTSERRSSSLSIIKEETTKVRTQVFSQAGSNPVWESIQVQFVQIVLLLTQLERTDQVKAVLEDLINFLYDWQDETTAVLIRGIVFRWWRRYEAKPFADIMRIWYELIENNLVAYQLWKAVEGTPALLGYELIPWRGENIILKNLDDYSQGDYNIPEPSSPAKQTSSSSAKAKQPVATVAKTSTASTKQPVATVAKTPKQVKPKTPAKELEPRQTRKKPLVNYKELNSGKK